MKKSLSDRKIASINIGKGIVEEFLRLVRFGNGRDLENQRISRIGLGGGLWLKWIHRDRKR